MTEMFPALLRWFRSSYERHSSVCDVCGFRVGFPVWPRCPECGQWAIYYRKVDLTVEQIALLRHVGVAWCTEAQFEALLAGAERERVLREALAFAASCIKSGEPWTASCEAIIGAALAQEGKP